jgi:hypothetical protein
MCSRMRAGQRGAGGPHTGPYAFPYSFHCASFRGIRRGPRKSRPPVVSGGAGVYGANDGFVRVCPVAKATNRPRRLRTPSPFA